MLRNLSYHYKTPLTFTLVIAVTAMVVSATLIWRAYHDAKRELTSNALDLGKVLSRTLQPALLHDELWQAYEIIATPLDPRQRGRTLDRIFTVLDAKNQIYVSTLPDRFPTLDRLSLAGGEYPELERRVIEGNSNTPVMVDESGWEFIHVAVPILAEDGVRMGTVLLSFSRQLFLPQFHAALGGVLLSTIAVLVFLLPIGWLLGKRMAAPLEYLAGAMAKVGREPPGAIGEELPQGRDEIGTLSTRFGQMLKELEEKKAMEGQMLASERLAAIGRLTAGIAHEINNPLGGMLNAISTYKKHGHPDAMTLKTISLLERGLLQIRQTVGALLVEARLESHALTPQDIEDARTLVAPEAQQKKADLIWNSEIAEPLPLPSTQVRQILLNLLLNAVAAVRPEGRLDCSITRINGSLRMAIANDGEQISRDVLNHLYEPFSHHGRDSGTSNGLGLWVTYQLVQQMHGVIEADSGPSRTTFTVTLPIEA